MSDPVLIAVDDDEDALRDIEATLRDRYGRDYRIECTRSPQEARALLEALATAHDDVALVARRPVARRDDRQRRCSTTPGRSIPTPSGGC